MSDSWVQVLSDCFRNSLANLYLENTSVVNEILSVQTIAFKKTFQSLKIWNLAERVR